LRGYWIPRCPITNTGGQSFLNKKIEIFIRLFEIRRGGSRRPNLSAFSGGQPLSRILEMRNTKLAVSSSHFGETAYMLGRLHVRATDERYSLCVGVSR
jgi:hypothetical protein